MIAMKTNTFMGFFFFCFKRSPWSFPNASFLFEKHPISLPSALSLPLSVAPRYPHNPFSFRSTSIHPLRGGGRTGDRPAHRWWSYHPSPLTVPPSDIPRQLPSLSPQWMFVFPTNVGQSVEEDDIRPPGVQTPPMERHLQALETNTWDIIKIKGWVLGGGGLYAFKNDIPLRLLRRSRDN